MAQFEENLDSGNSFSNLISYHMCGARGSNSPVEELNGEKGNGSNGHENLTLARNLKFMQLAPCACMKDWSLWFYETQKS